MNVTANASIGYTCRVRMTWNDCTMPRVHGTQVREMTHDPFRGGTIARSPPAQLIKVYL